MSETSKNNLQLSERVIERLTQAISTIKARYSDRLIELCLYGSYAKGTESKYSSIDIIVIVAGCDLRFIQRKAELERMLNEDSNIPLIDPLVYTESEVLDLIQKQESFIASAFKEAVVLWNGFNEIDLNNLSKMNIIKSRYSVSLPKLEEW